MTLSRRPLTSSDADGELFVDRADELRRIERSIELSANVLVVGPAGSGKTSLVRRLQARSRERGTEWAYVDCSPWERLELAMAAIGTALGHERRERSRDAFGGPNTPQIVTEIDVHEMLEGEPRVIVADGVQPELAFDLFGRFRDALWEHDHRWVVTADISNRGDFLRAPADVFFETVVELAAMPSTVIEQLLVRRAQELAGNDQELLLSIARVLGGDEQPDRQPGEAVAIARAAMAADVPIEHLVARRQDAGDRASAIGRSAGEVFHALREIGAVHAGDERLLQRVGLSRARVVQLLRQLNEAGLVESRRVGRRVMYGIDP